jgi:hypothetical protein
LNRSHDLVLAEVMKNGTGKTRKMSVVPRLRHKTERVSPDSNSRHAQAPAVHQVQPKVYFREQVEDDEQEYPERKSSESSRH